MNDIEWILTIFMIAALIFMFSFVGYAIYLEDTNTCIKTENQCYYSTSILVGKVMTRTTHNVDCYDERATDIKKVCITYEEK